MAKHTLRMDLYAVLHLPRDASVQDVKTSFRKLALVHHPDRQAGASPQEQAQAATRFAQIQEAYEVLSDDSKRANYQRYGRSGGASTSGRYRSQSSASAGYDPFARSDWSYSTPRRRPRGSMYQTLGRIAAGMTRADGLFHLALAGILVFGGMFADQIGSALWDTLNQGRGFDRIEQLAAQKKQAALDALDKRDEASPDQLNSSPASSYSAQMAPSFASAPATSAPEQRTMASTRNPSSPSAPSSSPQTPTSIQLQPSAQLSTSSGGGSSSSRAPQESLQQPRQDAATPQLKIPAAVSSGSLPKPPAEVKAAPAPAAER